MGPRGWHLKILAWHFPHTLLPSGHPTKPWRAFRKKYRPLGVFFWVSDTRCNLRDWKFQALWSEHTWVKDLTLPYIVVPTWTSHVHSPPPPPQPQFPPLESQDCSRESDRNNSVLQLIQCRKQFLDKVTAWRLTCCESSKKVAVTND